MSATASESPFSNLPNALQPRLRVFFSVDLAGSTAFKQAGSPDGTWLEDGGLQDGAWQKVMLGFYKEFDSYLVTTCEDFTARYPGYQHYIPKTFDFWKSLGDELLYQMILTDAEHLCVLIRIWVKALESYGSRLRDLYPSLDVKSTAWVAGFPLRNSEVIFERNKSDAPLSGIQDALVYQFDLLNRWHVDATARNNLSMDFIGPSIDTGFRLSSKSTPRKMCITVDLAHILAMRMTNTDFAAEHAINVFFEGRHDFKGVVGGGAYPVFCIKVPMADDLVIAEEALLIERRVGQEELAKYCKAYIAKNGKFIGPPFIADCSDAGLRAVPAGYVQKLNGRKQRMEAELGKAKDQLESLQSPSEALPQTKEAQVAGEDLGVAIVKFIEALKDALPKSSPNQDSAASRLGPKKPDDGPDNPLDGTKKA